MKDVTIARETARLNVESEYRCPRCDFRLEVPNDLAESLKAQNRYLDHLSVHFHSPLTKHQSEMPGPQAIADRGDQIGDHDAPRRQRGPSNRSKQGDG